MLIVVLLSHKNSSGPRANNFEGVLFYYLKLPCFKYLLVGISEVSPLRVVGD